MQIPSNILLSNMRPSRYLPALEIIWCILTIAMACVQSVQGVYVIRFLLGLAEAGFYPGVRAVFLFNKPHCITMYSYCILNRLYF